MPVVAVAGARHHYARTSAAFVLCVFACSALACRTDPLAQLTRRVPTLDRDFARHLVADDDSSFARYCAQTGWPRVYFANWTMSEHKDTRTLAAFVHTDAEVLQYQRKIFRALGPAFGLHEQGRQDLAVADTPAEQRYQVLFQSRQLEQEARELPESASALDAKEALLLRLLAEFGNSTSTARAKILSKLADLQLSAQRTNRALDYRRASVDAAREVGGWIYCQELGGLGELMAQRGDVDSMTYFWQLGLDEALRHRIDDHAARLNMFFGNHHELHGRWALASDYLREARLRARDLGGNGTGLRVRLESLEFPARLGCWNMIGRELRGAGAELRQARSAGSPWTPNFDARLFELQAMYASNQGDVAAADRWFAQSERIYVRMRGRDPKYPRMLAQWGRALVAGGQPARALRICQRGLAYCDRASIPEYVPAIAIVQARALLEQGNRDGSRSALEEFRHAALPRRDVRLQEWIEYDALLARGYAADGNRESTIHALRAGLARIEADLVAMDPGPESYLFLSGENELREIMHGMVADDPELGLRIERSWRRATALLRAAAPTGDLVHCADLVSARLTRAESVRPASLVGAATHAATADSSTQVIYFVGEHVIRWTVDGRGVQRDVLAVSKRDLEVAVEGVVARMASPPSEANAGVDPELQAELRTLCRALLPPALTNASAGSGMRWLQVYPDGVLCGLPFEALNVSPDGYRPLLADWNVVYVRGISSRRDRPTSRTGLVIADPEISPRLGQLHGGLPRLGLGLAEIAPLVSGGPGPQLLTGPAATKRALLAAWQQRGYIYFATHVIEDPETPLVGFIPLAPDSTATGVDSEYLEVADVLGADLSRCGLVVLSGCASGVSSRLAVPGGPSLASAFLDAGAEAAIRTSWQVRDDQAAALMSEFNRSWRSGRVSPAAALNAAKRKASLGPSGFRHPASWAGYAIDIAGPLGEHARTAEGASSIRSASRRTSELPN